MFVCGGIGGLSGCVGVEVLRSEEGRLRSTCDVRLIMTFSKTALAPNEFVLGLPRHVLWYSRTEDLFCLECLSVNDRRSFDRTYLSLCAYIEINDFCKQSAEESMKNVRMETASAQLGDKVAFSCKRGYQVKGKTRVFEGTRQCVVDTSLNLPNGEAAKQGAWRPADKAPCESSLTVLCDMISISLSVSLSLSLSFSLSLSQHWYFPTNAYFDSKN